MSDLHPEDDQAMDAHLQQLRDENKRLREALRDLLDEQNGPPLYTREKQWNDAVAKAQAALAGGGT